MPQLPVVQQFPTDTLKDLIWHDKQGRPNKWNGVRVAANPGATAERAKRIAATGQQPFPGLPGP